MPSNVTNVIGLLKPSFSSGLQKTEDGFVALNETQNVLTGSFISALDEDGLFSTQQLKVDWSKFHNHTFFQSAQVKTNFAFQKIIQKYPFDGSQKEFEEFDANLTGWEKYILNRFPKHKGYLWFSGSSSSVGGTYVTVNDSVGAEYPEISLDKSGIRTLSPMTRSFSIETFLFIPPITNENSIVLQKTNDTSGFLMYLSKSASTSEAQLFFKITSSSIAVSASATVVKDKWNHIAVDWNKNQLFLSINNNLIGTSSIAPILTSINAESTNLLIGSGSSFDSFTPEETLSGSMDELRIWFGVTRSYIERAKDLYTSIYAVPNLNLYFKFNEASGSTSPVVLDSSGKGMHGTLNTHAFSTTKVRNVLTSSLDSEASPLIYEDINKTPVLFPEHPGVLALRTEFINSGSLYDDVNPSLITKLLPKHLFLEAQAFDNLETLEGEITTNLDSTTGGPRTTRLGGTNFLLSLLYLWAHEFDEMKLFSDALGLLTTVNYDNDDTMPSVFLERYAKTRGFQLPSLFTNASIQQYIGGSGIINDYQNQSEKTLREIQYQIWRRILTNLNDIIESKGTIHSVKAFFRALGIDPDASVYIHEHGSGQRYSLENNPKVFKHKSCQFLRFNQGGYIRTPVLSSSRVEPGWPLEANTAADGVLTSGSWTVESVVSFISNSLQTNPQQSCLRVSGENLVTNDMFIYANLVAVSGSGFTLFVKPVSSSINVYSVSIDAKIENKLPWFVSFGRTRSDDTGFNIINHPSSSYFLRVGQMDGETTSFFSSSYVYVPESTGSIFQMVSSSVTGQTNGCFLEIGERASSIGTGFLTGSSDSQLVFTGDIGFIRFWSKALSVSESIEHNRNFTSIGAINPIINWNFNVSSSGSFERLRLDSSCQQAEKITNGSGKIYLRDFSQNNFVMTGSNFQADTNVVVNKQINLSTFSYHLDNPSTTNKVRVRGLNEKGNYFADYFINQGRAFEVPQFEEKTDANKFSIEFSAVAGLNEDIMNTFANMQFLNDALGSPASLFEENYRNLEKMSENYFNRLTTKPNLKTFFEYYKWLDTNISSFIEQLIPITTTFSGLNYVVESHVLERAKLKLYGSNLFLGEADRVNAKRNLFLRQIVGQITR